jgi:hypothetical protein
LEATYVNVETDARLIEAEAEKRLQQSQYPEIRGVLCKFRHGTLTLNGVVPTFHVRQIAQELVQGLERVQILDNQLVVKARKGSSSHCTESSAGPQE